MEPKLSSSGTYRVTNAVVSRLSGSIRACSDMSSQFLMDSGNSFGFSSGTIGSRSISLNSIYRCCDSLYLRKHRMPESGILMHYHYSAMRFLKHGICLLSGQIRYGCLIVGGFDSPSAFGLLQTCNLILTPGMS